MTSTRSRLLDALHAQSHVLLIAVCGPTLTPSQANTRPHTHTLTGYLLTPDPDQRPTIWQVCEVVFRLKQSPNPVLNVFVSLLRSVYSSV